MRVRNIKTNQKGQAKLTLKDYLKQFEDQLLQPFLWCASSTVSVAIVLSIPARAEARLSVFHNSQNTNIEFSSLLSSEIATKNSAVEQFNKGTFNRELPHAPTEESFAASEKPLPPHNLKLVDPSSIELAIENTESIKSVEPVEPVFPPSFNAQGDELEPSNSAIELTLEPVELSFPADPIAQSDPTPPPVEPSPATESNDRWQFSVEPYFFVPFDVDAEVTVDGRSTSIDFGLDDILNLDRAFDAGLRLEAQHDRWGFILDGFYLFASDSGSLGRTFSAGSLLQFVQQTDPERIQRFTQQFDPQQIQQIVQTGQQIGLDTPIRVTADGSVSVRQITVDAAVSYRVVDTSLDNSPEETSPEETNFYPRLVIAPIVGLRTNFLRQTVEVDTVRIDNIPIPDDRLPTIDRDFRFSRTLVEPLIGAQFGLDLSDRWALGLRGDVSGFNIGADRNLTWNLLVGAQYRLSRIASLQLAYRFNSFEFEDGEGLRRTKLNLDQDGLWLSAVFRF